MVFPDTSFLCGLYVPQSTSARAITYMGAQATALEVSSLLLYEFRQSIQFQVFRHGKDRTQGYSLGLGQAALAALQSRQARTRLSARSYAVCPRRGRTWSRVMTSGEVSVPQ